MAGIASMRFSPWWTSATRAGATIHTSLWRDIIAHETGPRSSPASRPTSTTPPLHKAIADLTAMLFGLSSDEVRSVALAQSGNRIEVPNAFNWVAEEFGRGARPGAGRGTALAPQRPQPRSEGR